MWDISLKRLDTPAPVQAKLTIGKPGDKYEQEADETARQVVQRIHQPRSEKLQRESLPQEEEELQMKPMVQRVSDGGIAASSDLETSIQQARGGGQPLAESIKSPMERAFGADFSGVKVHVDSQADQLNRSIQAKAFTTGQDVFFRQGAYEPGSPGGQELLAHELTHVVQQRGNSVIQPDILDEPIPSDVEENLSKPLKTESIIEQADKIIKQLESLKNKSSNSISDEKKEELNSEMNELLIEEKRVRKTIIAQINVFFSKMKDVNKVQYLEKLQEYEDLEEEEKPPVPLLLQDMIENDNLDSEYMKKLQLKYQELSQSRIETKVKVKGEDKRDITSKNENAKYKNLIKMDTEERLKEKNESRLYGFEGRTSDGNNNDYDKGVYYPSQENRQYFKINPLKKGEETIYVDKDGKPLDTSKAQIDKSLDPASTLKGAFIFIMDENGEIYVADENLWNRVLNFHHSSFLAGKPVAAAGEIAFSAGRVTNISNISGHYRPSEIYTYQVLLELKSQGMDVDHINIRFSDASYNDIQGKDMLEYYREKNAKNTELSLKEWTEEKRAVK